MEQHIENTAAKLKTRNNIIHKLIGSTRGGQQCPLRTSALALVYSSLLINTSHCSKIDVQLNRSMCIIFETVKSTPTEWPSNQNLRLKSIKPAYLTLTKFIENQYKDIVVRKIEWRNSSIYNYSLTKEPGYPGPWTTFSLSRVGNTSSSTYGHGRSGEMLHKWKMRNYPDCDGGHSLQFISHIIRTVKNSATDIDKGTWHPTLDSLNWWQHGTFVTLAYHTIRW